MNKYLSIIYNKLNKKQQKSAKKIYYLFYAKLKGIKIKSTNNTFEINHKNKIIILSLKEFWAITNINEILNYMNSNNLNKLNLTKKRPLNVNSKKHLIDIDTEFLFAIKQYNLNYNPKPGDVILDVGSYHGIYSLYIYDKIQPKGKIYCFEPDPYNFKILSKNIKRYNLKNIFLINKALFNKTTKLELNIQDMGSSLFDLKKATEKITINTISVNDFIKEYKIKKIDFVKMDVEGAELEIVESFLKTTFKPNFAIASYHLRNNKMTNIQLEKMFKENKWFVETKNKLHLTTFAKK